MVSYFFLNPWKNRVYNFQNSREGENEGGLVILQKCDKDKVSENKKNYVERIKSNISVPTRNIKTKLPYYKMGFQMD